MERQIERILVVGDSLSKGVVFNEAKQRYTYLKDCFVNRINALLRPEIVNAAKFGTTVQYAEKVLDVRLDTLVPDAVFLEFGGNDCDFDWGRIAEDPSLDHQPKTPLPVFEQKLEQLAGRIRAAGKLPLFMTLPPLDAPAYFKWFTNGCEQKSRAILKWLGDVGRIYWWHERYSAAVTRVARRTKAFLFDIRSAFLACEDYRTLICRDGIHPNERGHALMANTIADILEQCGCGGLLAGEG